MRAQRLVLQSQSQSAVDVSISSKVQSQVVSADVCTYLNRAFAADFLDNNGLSLQQSESAISYFRQRQRKRAFFDDTTQD